MNEGTYTLTVKASFAAAHSLRGYEGNCERLHGHNWVVEVAVEARDLDARGIAVDFRAIKEALREVLLRLDHRLINEVPPFDAWNPSSENIARFVFEEMERRIPPPPRVSRVTVWESEDARADFSRRP